MLTRTILETDLPLPLFHRGKVRDTYDLGDKLLMASDAPPDRFDQPKGFSVTLGVDTAAEAERIYNTFAEGGTVRMPMEETFFAERFGMVTDRFGTPWMILCEKKAA